MAVVLNPHLELADVREVLLENDTNTEGIRRDALFEQLRGAILQYSGLQRARDFLSVAEEHPDWLHIIFLVALRAIDSSSSISSKKEDALLTFFTLIGNICTVAQGTTRALANLRVLRWGSAPCEHAAGTEQLMQAMYQGVGAWNPAGALLVALRQTLSPSAVRLQLASTVITPGSEAQLGSTPQLETDLGMAHLPCANMRRMLEEGMGMKDVVSVAERLGAEVLGASTFMADVEAAGCTLLRDFYSRTDHKLSSLFAGPRDVILTSLHFMASNTGMCAAWTEETRVLEVYKWTQPAKNHGVLKLVHILMDVRKLPLWRDSLVQEFTIQNGRLLSLSQDCQGYEASKKMSKRNLYEPVKVATEDTERYVEAVLQSSNIRGGCWNTIIHGRPPTAGVDAETGFRMAPLCVAVAGLTIWFPCEDYKTAAWIQFPNIMLRGGHCLTLGTCDVKAEKSGRSGKRPHKVVFVAGRDSQIWKTRVMFG